MGEARKNHVLELIDLRMQRGIEPGVGMAEQVDPPGADGIQVALALEVFQPHALAAADRNQRQVLLVILHLRAGMPDVREVARSQLGVGAGAGSKVSHGA